MRHLILLSALLLGLSWTPFGGSPLQKATTISRSTRGHLNDEATLYKLSTSLPDTTCKDGLDHCIARMLGKQMHLSERHLNVVRQKKAADIAEGIGKDALFFVKSSSGAYRYVVKAYSEGQRLASELSASDLLAQLQLKEARVPALSAIGRASTAEGHYSLLAYEYLPGEPVTRLMQRVSESRLPEDRTAALEVACLAMQRIGSALAELHSARVEVSSELAPYFASKEERILSGILPFLEGQPDKIGISSRAFERLFRRQQQARSKVACCHTYAHLECHMANWLYEEKSDSLSMIDLQTLHYSVGEGGRPLASPWVDYLIVYFNLEGTGDLYRLTPAEIATLQQAFHTHYTEASKLPAPHPEELTFYSLLYWMNIIRIFDRQPSTDLPSLVAQKKEMVDWATRGLAECLENLIGDDPDSAHKEHREGEAAARQRVVGL